MKEFYNQIKQWYLENAQNEEFTLCVLIRVLFIKISFPQLLIPSKDFYKNTLLKAFYLLSSPESDLCVNKILSLPEDTKYTLSDDAFLSDKGLLTILNQYTFTKNENTTDCITPETLGTVFENILSLFNPETKEESRKKTGSFYTPREIIDYMIDESLKADLAQKLPDIPDINTTLSDQQRVRIIQTIYDMKCLDPACGSGSFLVRLTIKLLKIFEKIDPQGLIQDIIISKNIAPKIKPLLFSQPQFTRTLYLITHCVYGMDIQHMAIFITKLRFFIFLLNTQSSQVPLPNLDSNFVTGDFLLSNKQQGELFCIA